MSAPLTRRAAIVGALTSTAALAVPAAAAMQTVEAPHERVYRLGRELAKALADPDWQGFRRATVTPTQVAFDDDAAAEPTPGNRYNMTAFAINRFQRLADAHQKADAAFLAVCDGEDDDAIDTTFEVADAALMAICSYVPSCRFDERARADYLAGLTEITKRFGFDLERRHLAALFGSMGRYQDTFHARIG